MSRRNDNTEIGEGAIFYGQPRRRQNVEFTPDLRTETETVARQLHELIRSGKTPPAEYGKFLARIQGPISGNVLLRREQYRVADHPEATSQPPARMASAPWMR